MDVLQRIEYKVLLHHPLFSRTHLTFCGRLISKTQAVKDASAVVAEISASLGIYDAVFDGHLGSLHLICISGFSITLRQVILVHEARTTF